MRRHHVARAVLDEDRVEPLVRRARDGDGEAWADLWLALAPLIEEIAGRGRVTGRLSSREDERRDIVVRVMGQLRANDFARLGLFHEVLLRRDRSARGWLVLLTKRSAISYVRVHPEYLGDDEQAWVELVPLADDLDEQLPVSMRAAQMAEAHRIEEYAERELTPLSYRMVSLWLAGHDHKEIAAKVGFAVPETEKRVRATLDRMRSQLRNGGGAREP